MYRLACGLDFINETEASRLRDDRSVEVFILQSPVLEISVLSENSWKRLNVL